MAFIEALLKVLIELSLKALPKTCRWINSLLSRKPPWLHSRREIERRLRAKFPNTDFHVSLDRNSFHLTTAEVLLSFIRKQMSVAAQDSRTVRVGIVCGPMVFHVVRQITDGRMVHSTEDFSHLRFVAMNRAAESGSFQFSANFLVTLLSSVFPHSKPVAYTYNSYDKTGLDDDREAVDILLCSAGSHPHSPPNYLEIWCRRMALVGDNHGGQTPLALPDECVGDFCLRPIEASGRTIDSEAYGRLLAAIDNVIDPHPRFNRIAEVTRSGTPKVIFPINIERGAPALAQDSPAAVTPLTGKEAVAKTVLHSGVVSACVLEKTIAKNLALSIGGFLLDRISKREAGKPLREAHAFTFQNTIRSRKIRIYDPHNRCDPVCAIDKDLHARQYSSSGLPDLVMSEYTTETATFDAAAGSGAIQFELDGKSYRFQIAPGVRKPGRFSLATFHVVSELLSRTSPSDSISFCDMGCGCGIVGILAKDFSRRAVRTVVFTDTSEEALKCTKSNLKRADKAQMSKGDVFSAMPADGTFDLIAFNPPFLPDGVADPLDCGGPTGLEIANRFCEHLKKHLKPGGWGVLTVADYVDNGSLRRSLLKGGFGKEDIRVEEQVVLYPYHTEMPVPRAYEIANKAAIEEKCRYKFEVCTLGQLQFLAFTIRVYVAQRRL